MGFQCEECQREFRSEEGLSQHKRDKHGLGSTKQEMKQLKKQRKEEQKKIEIKQASKSKLMKRISYIALSALIIVIAGYLIMNQPPTNIIINADADVRSIVVEGGVGNEYSFSPNQLSIAKGEVVRVSFNNKGRISHNWVLRGYNVATNTITPGAYDTVKFVADKSGNFEYYCSLRGHRERGMLGSLVVT